MFNGDLQDAKLVADRAVEASVILMAAAGREDHAFGKLFEKAGDGRAPFLRLGKIVEAELEEGLACLGFPPGILQQAFKRGQTEGDTYFGEHPFLRHPVLTN